MDIQERPATLAKGERSSRSWWPAQRRATQSRRAQGRERQEELFFSGKGDFGPLSKNGWVSEKVCGGMKIGGGKMEKEEAGFKMEREEELGCKPCKEETGRGTSGGRRPPGTSRCYIKKVHVCQQQDGDLKIVFFTFKAACMLPGAGARFPWTSLLLQPGKGLLTNSFVVFEHTMK